MSIIKALMGRRQFIAASVASTCALTWKRAAALEPALQAASLPSSAAGVNQKGGTAITKTAASTCPHLLAPLAIRGKVLKNRIMYAVAGHFTFQGPENYPSEAYRNHYSNVAKNAAIVTVVTQFGQYPKTYHSRKENPDMWGWEHLSNNKWEDIPATWNYIERMLEDIHCEGSLAVFGSNTGDVGDQVVAGDVTSEDGHGGMSQYRAATPNGGGAGAHAPGATPLQTLEEFVNDAKAKESLGYDVYMLASTDPAVAQAIRNATNMILIAPFNTMVPQGAYPSLGAAIKPTSAQIEKAIEEAKKLEGVADIFFMKSGGTAGASWETSEYGEGLAYYLAESIKEAGVKINICIGTGLHNPARNDEYIAKGVVDMVGMTRPIIADPNLVAKIAAGKADEVQPCLQCQSCHSESMTSGLHISRCTVNPAWEMTAYKLRSIDAPLTKKKVAVIGGGPAGMKAAIIAAERGHRVTLYEKEAALGGQQEHTDYSAWVWTYKTYKDYLAHMIKKQGVEVKLNTKATPAMIKAGGYDTVLVALGSELNKSNLKGSDANTVFDVLTCYSKKKSLGQNVVVVGAGKIGIEAGLSMALDGHKVTVLSTNGQMYDPADIGAHNVTAQTKLYKGLPNFKYSLNNKVTDIQGGKVTYTDKDGANQTIEADSIVLWNGLKPRTQEAASFMGSAPEVHVLGDCNGQNGRIISATRNAFIVASRV